MIVFYGLTGRLHGEKGLNWESEITNIMFI